MEEIVDAYMGWAEGIKDTGLGAAYSPSDESTVKGSYHVRIVDVYGEFSLFLLCISF